MVRAFIRSTVRHGLTSERDLRPLKTQQKISGRLISETTSRHRLTLRSYSSTAAKHGTDAMTALRDALAGQTLEPSSRDGLMLTHGNWLSL